MGRFDNFFFFLTVLFYYIILDLKSGCGYISFVLIDPDSWTILVIVFMFSYFLSSIFYFYFKIEIKNDYLFLLSVWVSYYFLKIIGFLLKIKAIGFIFSYFNFISVSFFLLLVISPKIYNRFKSRFTFLVLGNLFSVSFLWSFIFVFLFFLVFLTIFGLCFFFFNKPNSFLLLADGGVFTGSIFLSFFSILFSSFVLLKLRFSYYVFVWGRDYKDDLFRNMSHDCFVMMKICLVFLGCCEFGLHDINDEFFKLKFEDMGKNASFFNLFLFASSMHNKFLFISTLCYYYIVLGYILLIFWFFFFFFMFLFSTNSDLGFIERYDAEVFLYLFTFASFVTSLYFGLPLLSVLGYWDYFFLFSQI